MLKFILFSLSTSFLFLNLTVAQHLTQNLLSTTEPLLLTTEGNPGLIPPANISMERKKKRACLLNKNCAAGYGCCCMGALAGSSTAAASTVGYVALWHSPLYTAPLSGCAGVGICSLFTCGPALILAATGLALTPFWCVATQCLAKEKNDDGDTTQEVHQ